MFKKERYRNFLLVLTLLSCTSPRPLVSSKPPIKIAVIDTGYKHSYMSTSNKICTSGHYDFDADKPGIGFDINGHGSHVADAIVDYAGEGNYCLLIYKVTDKGSLASADNIAKALRKAKASGAKIYNISLNGYGDDFSDRDEHGAMIQAGFSAYKIFVAAGNNKANLNKGCYSFPACYSGVDNKEVVGAKGNNLGNYGDIVSIKEKYCYYKFCGTSASTAIATGKYTKGLMYEESKK